MTDLNGREIQLGDHIILTVSRKSYYLTSAIIESINEETGEIGVRYSSTIKTKTIHSDDPFFIYQPRPYVLNGELGLCRDCTNQIIKPGDKVAYRSQGDNPISYGTVEDVISDLWVVLVGGVKVRNVGIFVL
jgi:hypothetical protein